MTLNPALPNEGQRYDIHTEMCLTARPMPGMARMQVRFVLDIEALRRESFAQLVGDSVPGAHVPVLMGRDYVPAGFASTAHRECEFRNVKT